MNDNVSGGMITDVERMAKEKGLPEFTTKQLIDLIKIELLYTIYKDLESIVVEKPVKPKKPNYPIEPVRPSEPKEPELKTINGSTPEVEKINIELYNDYKNKYSQYLTAQKVYTEAILEFTKLHAKFNDEKLAYPHKIEEFEKQQAKYEKDLIKYEKFIFQKELNQKVKQTYAKWTGKEFNYLVKSDKMTYFMLIGPPGHGKTTVFRQSSKMVASELGLVYKENPTVNDVVDLHSFVLYVNNWAGEVSKMGTAGLPTKVRDDDGNEYTGLLPSYSMSALTKASAGILLLDDLANASAFIQNIALPLTNENSFNELKLDGVYVGVTANMGALDGTNTSTISSALRNRLKVVFTKDDINDFIMRVRQNEKYFDEIGDFFISDFLENKKDQLDYLNKLFYTLPKKTEMGGFSNPRSLDSTINEARRIVYDYGGFNESTKDVIKLSLMSTLGKEVGEDLYEYIYDVHLEIAPMIDQFFEKNIFNNELFEKHTQSFLDPRTKLFEYKFRKYLEKKVRAEAFKVGRATTQEKKAEQINMLFDKISSIYPILTEKQQGAFSASLREEVFLNMKDFYTFHPNNNTKQILKSDLAFDLIKKIKEKTNSVENEESFDLALSSIALSNVSKNQESNKPPKRRARHFQV